VLAPGMAKEPSSHFERSIILHLSEQKGRQGFVFWRGVGVEQFGHGVFMNRALALVRMGCKADKICPEISKLPVHYDGSR